MAAANLLTRNEFRLANVMFLSGFLVFIVKLMVSSSIAVFAIILLQVMDEPIVYYYFALPLAV